MLITLYTSNQLNQYHSLTKVLCTKKAEKAAYTKVNTAQYII